MEGQTIAVQSPKIQNLDDCCWPALLLKVMVEGRREAEEPGDGETSEVDRGRSSTSRHVASGQRSEQTGQEAFVTMVTSDDFVIGAEVMFHSLREHSRIRRPLVVMVTSEVSKLKRESLKSVADEIFEVRCWSLCTRDPFSCSPMSHASCLGCMSERMPPGKPRLHMYVCSRTSETAYNYTRIQQRYF